MDPPPEETWAHLSAPDYIEKVVRNAPAHLADSFRTPSPSPPKICYFGSDPYREHTFVTENFLEELISQVRDDRQLRNSAICIIENISPSYIGRLGPAWDIDPFFFADHARHMDKDRFWLKYRPWSWPTRDQGTGKYTHLDGMFEYKGLEKNPETVALNSMPNVFPRDCFQEDPYDIQCNTRISYCRAQSNLYLFLVDAPLTLAGCTRRKNSRSRTTLRFPLTQRRVLLPQLFANQNYCLYDFLRTVFRHNWHRAVLFDSIDTTLPHHPMFYLISSSLWETNLRHITTEIRRISFRDLRNPKDTTNDELHDAREDLDYLRRFVGETLQWKPSTLQQYFLTLPRFAPGPQLRSLVHEPVQNLERILQDAKDLQEFLVDTFQLLMSSLTVRESRLNIEQAKLSAEQARRSAWLTQLASIYLPLSVVTGIFGMNLKETDEGSPSFWWAIVVLGVLMVLTMGIYYALKTVENLKEKRREAKKLAGREE